MKVLGHLSVSKRINTNHPWFHLAIFGLSSQMYFDGIISKREAKKMLGRKKKLNSKKEKLASLFIDQIAVNDNCQVFV